MALHIVRLKNVNEVAGCLKLQRRTKAAAQPWGEAAVKGAHLDQQQAQMKSPKENLQDEQFGLLGFLLLDLGPSCPVSPDPCQQLVCCLQWLA